MEVSVKEEEKRGVGEASPRASSTNGTENAAQSTGSGLSSKEEHEGNSLKELKKESMPSSSDKNIPANGDTSSEKPLSKNQLKKRRRYEKAMATKKRRKLQQKEAKIAKAIAEGRDLDKERRIQEERTKLGEGRRRRDAFLQARKEKSDNSFQVCFDCSFSSVMSSKEVGSLSNQIRYSYAMNKKSKNPCLLSIASLSGDTYENLTRVAGFPELWRKRNFECSDKPIMEMHPDKSKLVYLTADSENIIDHLDDGKIYVVGGIVDRNRLKGVTMAKANELGIQTAKLPISHHLKLFATKVLTCNHVFEILLKYREHGNDWKKAMMDVLPKRKDAEVIQSDGSDVKKSVEA
mmetsp:Transcript_47817/g.144615  ORF Transcript_47817/g.144615 Transcript_47817/m.144615 type:complete len:349 (-) Transcript_47817:184-1230(-)|eukprot:CAMPEP_0113553260 /NCGR_PEP_ID=MMETSP0015_2-20120614/15517_1 /TAXON_ID=2838 /ORGANISM="Odontella" /LENGTH=348 /DNA_ID=CAMNT_0000454315 /DNA_START=133 /DNA_END=1179 /DNA_ORIENTATION=- /assembly_acc=CAM_ASM_000160